MSNNKLKFGIICYQYAFEVSPILQNIASYLQDQNNIVEIVTNQRADGTESKLPQFNIHTPKYNFIHKKLRELSRANPKKEYIAYLTKYLESFDFLFVPDFESLDIINKAKFPIDKCVFISLEGADYMNNYSIYYVKQLLTSCALCIAPSKERSALVDNYVKFNLKWEYLPISKRPFNSNRIVKDSSDKFKIIYSGYIADWSCLKEFLIIYNSKPYYKNILLIQGHDYGTESYYNEIFQLSKNNDQINFDKSYYSETDHNSLINKFDIGIVFYKDISNTGNFTNLIYSSGKIASYLWNGLAVITNIDHPITKKPPFLFLPEFDRNLLNKLLERYNKNRMHYTKEAYKLAESFYNFDKFFKKIIKKLI